MIDRSIFDTLQGLTIPEGVVTQITDASGAVIWAAKPSTAKVTLTANTFEDKTYCSVYIYFVTPDGNRAYLSTAGEYELPIGTLIDFEIRYGGKDRISAYIHFNGETVVSSDADAYYDVTLTTNLTIEPVNRYYQGAEIYITEE